MKLTWKDFLVIVVLAAVWSYPVKLLVDIAVADAHTGSPAAKTWTSGETLTHTDLNNTILHLHNTFSGGITNAHIASNAAIAHTKLASPRLIPKAYAEVSDCTSTPCTILSSVGVTAVARTSTGLYTVDLAYDPADVYFSGFPTSDTDFVNCRVTNRSVTSPANNTVTCRADDGHGSIAAGTVADAAFSFTVLD